MINAPTHPHAYSAAEVEFLDGLRRVPTPIPPDDFEYLRELLGRVPSYEVVDGKFDYDRPILMSHRFTDEGLAKRGVANIMFHGRPFSIKGRI